jgi:hypothetical protein
MPQQSETPHARYGPTKWEQILSIYLSLYVRDPLTITIELLPSFTGEAGTRWLFGTSAWTRPVNNELRR